MLRNTLGLNQDININLAAPYLGWSYVGTAVSPLGQSYVNRLISLPGKPSGTLTIEDKDVLRLEQLLNEVQERLKILAVTNVEWEIPEVFQLQPLARTRVSIKIRKVEQAQFYFAGNDELDAEDIET